MEMLTVVIVLVTVTMVKVSPVGCQICPVEPEITYRTVCQVSTWALSVTCTSPSSVIVWSGSILTGHFVVSYTLTQQTSPALNVNGISATESHTNNSDCLTSHLTFYGSNLNDFNSIAFSCGFTKYSEANILIPSGPASPEFTQAVLSSTCNSNVITVKWTPPPSMQEIEMYLLDVTGQPGFTCSPDQCKVVNATTTNITGLIYNTSYMITVRAVNCIGEGNYSQPLVIDVPPTKCETIANSTSSVPIPSTVQGMDSKSYKISFWTIVPILFIITISLLVILISFCYQKRNEPSQYDLGNSDSGK